MWSSYIQTDKQQADIFSKPITKTQFEKLRGSIGLIFGTEDCKNSNDNSSCKLRRGVQLARRL